ncbi:MAG: ATP-dependent helicase [Lachnospiraceae bacterium]|nr:ATP-dependent helicase [Lachnospiraceae bacterium]
MHNICSYSPEQLKAVEHFKGAAEVLAAPGSGKTRVITGRLAYLINNKKIPPSSILTITFTRAAANEMKERAKKLIGSDALAVNFGTFHSVFFSILRHTYRFGPENIIRFRTQAEIIKGIIKTEKIEIKESETLFMDILNDISRVKTGAVVINEEEEFALENKDFEKLYRLYVKEMNERRLIDFDDMLIRVNRLFKERPEVLKKWSEKFKFILIDEFQDIDRLQYETVKMLASPENNLFVVGDDDQSIYGFRGAEPSIMQDFAEDIENAVQMRLGTNYRSSGRIIEAAGKVIKENRIRIDKEVKAFGNAGEEPDIRTFHDREAEVAEMAKHFKNCNELDRIAILLRTNTEMSFFAERLAEMDIPVRCREKSVSVYDHFIAKDVLTYLDLAGGDRSRSGLYRVMNKPYRRISRSAASKSTFSFAELKKYHADDVRVLSEIMSFENQLRIIGSMRPYAAVHYILHGTGYLEYLRRYAEERGLEFERLREKALEIRNRAKNYASLDDWKSAIEESKRKLREALDEKGRDAVSIMTLHSSKGLEFPEVYIPDINDGIIPWKKAVLESELEEERRLLYVGMTRAIEKLHLWSIEEDFGKKMEKSSFLKPLSES